MSAQARLGSYAAVPPGANARILRLSTPILVAVRGYRARAMLGLHAPDDAERLCRGIDSCDRRREAAVRVDGAGSGGVVEPGDACWVGVCGAPGVVGREVVGMICRCSNAIGEVPIVVPLFSGFSPCPFGAEIIYPAACCRAGRNATSQSGLV